MDIMANEIPSQFILLICSLNTIAATNAENNKTPMLLIANTKELSKVWLDKAFIKK